MEPEAFHASISILHSISFKRRLGQQHRRPPTLSLRSTSRNANKKIQPLVCYKNMSKYVKICQNSTLNKSPFKSSQFIQSDSLNSVDTLECSASPALCCRRGSLHRPPNRCPDASLSRTLCRNCCSSSSSGSLSLVDVSAI